MVLDYTGPFLPSSAQLDGAEDVGNRLLVDDGEEPAGDVDQVAPRRFGENEFKGEEEIAGQKDVGQRHRFAHQERPVQQEVVQDAQGIKQIHFGRSDLGRVFLDDLHQRIHPRTGGWRRGEERKEERKKK